MANNADVNPLGQGALIVDIPDLKKKEKERKKAGASWGGAKPGGNAFSGATGGTVARSAASAAGGAFQSVGGGGLSSLIGSLTATVMGKAMVTLGAVLLMGGAGLLGYSLLGGGAATGGRGDLGAIASSLKIRSGSQDRTRYVDSKGEIMFDPINSANKAEAGDEKNTADKSAGPSSQTADAADAAGANASWNRPSLAHNLSGSKLSSSLGGSFGGKNIFAGNSSAPKLNETLGKVNMPGNIPGGRQGRLSARGGSQTGRISSMAPGRRLKASRALGQLRVAKGMSTLGASMSAEGARLATTQAFEGGNGNGNVDSVKSIASVDTPRIQNPPNLAMPLVAIPTKLENGDPNTTAMIAAIAAMAGRAGKMHARAAIMMALGGLLIAIGIGLLFWPMTVVGIALITIGIMLLGMGKMMDDMGDMMQEMASSMSTSLAARNGDQAQNKANQYCIDQAAGGAPPNDCKPPESINGEAEFKRAERDGKQHMDEIVEQGRVEGQ